MRALLTNGFLRKTLAAARSLGTRGVEVGVGETSRLSPAAFSRFCSDRWRYPDPASEPSAFGHALLERIERRRYDTFLPMDDAAIEAAYERLTDLERLCRIPLPPADSYRIASDKGLSARHVQASGVDAPRTAYPASPEQVPALAAQLGYPVVIKPCRSAGSRGIRVVRRQEELMPVYLDVHARYPLPILQEFIPTGDRYDVCFIFDAAGSVRASFVQKEVRHYPLPMGPSTMQVSVWEPELVERARTIMRGLAWYGVAELEFMVDPRDGIPKFMEINPRFWNSLQLAIQSGVDFPWLLYRIARGDRVEECHTYAIGERCRNLVPGELLHFIASRDRFRMDPPLWAGASRGGHDDTFSLSDPMAGAGLLAAIGRHAFDPKVWKDMIRR